MCSPRSIVPWADRIEENWWSSAKQFLHIFQKDRDLEIPHRSWQTDGNPACGWARATSRTSTLSEQTTKLCMRQVYDDSQITAGQKRTSSQSPRPYRSRGRRQPMMQQTPRAVPEAHEQENQDEEANDNDGEDKESPDKPDGEDHDMEGGDASGTRHNCDAELEPRREARRNTRECVREKAADDEVTKATDHTCPTS